MTLSQIKIYLMPYGAKLRKNMEFGLLVRGTKITRSTEHSVIHADSVLWRGGPNYRLSLIVDPSWH